MLPLHSTGRPNVSMENDDNEKIYNEENDENFIEEENLLYQDSENDDSAGLDPNKKTSNKLKGTLFFV